jgi:hypothetical protein|tara:strand:+ start:226 stop:1290 length:1065 start_codon:yes stop_codon:yes gene_type:complete
MPFSLINTRGYLIDCNAVNNPMDNEALGKVLKRAAIEEPIETANILSEESDYDSYEIELKNGTHWRLKISLDPTTPVLKREAAVLKNSAGVATGKLHLLSDYTLGEKTPHLIFEFPPSFSGADMGISSLIEERRLLFGSYFALLQTLSPRRYYKSVVEEDFKKFNISSKNFPPPSRRAIKSHSNYPVLLDFFTTLREETDKHLPSPPMEKKCLGGLPLKSIFFSNGLFFFDHLHNTCLHHPFADFADFILDLGLEPEIEQAAFKDFCEVGSLEGDAHLYESIYALQLRKKLIELVGLYFTEVYVFQGKRVDNLIYLAETFSNCSKRFRRIPAFLPYQDFLFKTITEPILGVKAE